MPKAKLKKPEDKDPRNGGAPSKYKPEYCDLVKNLAAKAKMPIIWAKEIGVCKDTMTEWARSYDDFSVAYKEAKDICEAALFEKLGFEPSANRMRAIRFMLGAGFGVSEVQKIEQKVDATITTSLSDKFKDLDKGED